MRHLKTLTLAAMAVFALVAGAGAGTASATMLCTVATDPCPAASTIPSGTTINGAVKSGTNVILATSGGLFNPTITCAASTMMLTTTGTGGGAGTDVAVSLDGLSFSSCTSVNPSGCSASLPVVAGTLPQPGSVSWTSGFGGTLTVPTWPQFQITCPGPFGGTVTCAYGGNSVSGAFNGGNPAELVFSAATLRSGGSFCPTGATFNATYAAQAPMSAIYVTNA